MLDQVKKIKRRLTSYFPPTYNKRSLEKIVGKPQFDYDLNAINKGLTTPVWDLIERGGKHWRSTLFLMILEALNEDSSQYKDFSILPELIHQGSLIIDDIQDNSQLRRKKPCIHHDYGIDTAISSGNTLYFMSLLSLMKKIKIRDDLKIKIYDIYLEEMTNLSIAQGIDIAWQKSSYQEKAITQSQYLQMSYGKTGSLAKLASKTAAVLAGASNTDIHKIGEFSGTLGLCYQIQDDILSLLDKKMIKSKGQIGEDITTNKKTILTIYTLEKSNKKDRLRLLYILNMKTKNENLIQEVITLFNKYGAINAAKETAQQLMLKELNTLTKIVKNKDKLLLLKNFVFSLLHYIMT